MGRGLVASGCGRKETHMSSLYKQSKVTTGISLVAKITPAFLLVFKVKCQCMYVDLDKMEITTKNV